MTDGVNIAFSPAVARVPRGRDAPQADHGGASFRGKISFMIGALILVAGTAPFAEFHGLENGCQPLADPRTRRGRPERLPAKARGMLQRITALFLDGARSYNDQHVGLFDDVFGILIEEIEAKARAELANRLAR